MVSVTDVEALAPATRISFPAPTTVNSHQRDNVEKRSQSGHIITPCISTLIHLQGVLLNQKKRQIWWRMRLPCRERKWFPVEGFRLGLLFPHFLRGDSFNVTHGAGREARRA